VTKPDLDRLLRRKELVRVHPGVFIEHTGEPTDLQRAWAAVLYAAPAALCLESALDLTADPVHVAVDWGRRLVAPPSGVRIHRVRGFAARVRWNQSPPRVRLEHVVLDQVERAASESEMVRLMTEAVNGRRTTAARLRETLRERARARRRGWLEAVLDDIEHGCCSVLEHRYLTHVERAHGLPSATRQVTRAADSGRQYRDVEYEELGLVVELDGRVGHDTWDASGRDADRDLDDRADGREVLRLRHAQVFDRPCRTASRIAEVLARRGWTGSPRACADDCDLGTSSASAPAPDPAS
jgi:very-short-patch-repair endonuclease